MNDSTKKGFLIPLSIVSKAAKEGVGIAALQEMLGKSARCTHPQGNRRYHEYLFKIEGQRLTSFVKIEDDEDDDGDEYKCESCKDTLKVIVFDECGYCHGVGCKFCDNGLIANAINCPACTGKNYGHKPLRFDKQGFIR